MKYRKLRIALSVVCGILCLLFLALWVRSYHTADVFLCRISVDTTFSLGSRGGYFWVGQNDLALNPNQWTLWQQYPLRGQVFSAPNFESTQVSSLGRLVVMTRWGSKYGEIFLQHWIVGLIAAALSASPWLRWRFSLRTLLIAITLVAILLGAIVVSMR